MSGPEHLPPDGHELEDFLAGRGPHRARYHAASQEQAPAALDAAVLAKAQLGVAAPVPTVRASPRGLSRWRVPLSLAATVVLGVGLSTRVLRETPVLPAEPAPAATVTEAAAPTLEALQERAAADAVVAPPAAATMAESTASEAAVRTRVEESRARAAAEHERPDQDLAKAERQVRQTLAAAAPEVAAPPPAPPAPAPPPPPAVAMKPQAPAPEAFAPAAGAGMAMSDAAPPPTAPPAAVTAAPAPRAEFQAKRRAALSAPRAEPVAILTGRYRAESGIELQLLADGRFTLKPSANEPAGVPLSGRRQREAGGERLLPDDQADLPCALWLQVPAAEEPGGAVQLSADCENRYAGVYRRENSEP